jgi:hypothetical protein
MLFISASVVGTILIPWNLQEGAQLESWLGYGAALLELGMYTVRILARI